MASASRSPLMSSGARILSRTLSPKCVPLSPFPSSTRALPRAASRIVGALGMVESMMPLHSAIASARLNSSLAANSTYWSWLSQGLGTSL